MSDTKTWTQWRDSLRLCWVNLRRNPSDNHWEQNFFHRWYTDADCEPYAVIEDAIGDIHLRHATCISFREEDPGTTGEKP